MNQIYTVSQVNSYLKNLLDKDVQMQSIFIRGEISNFVHHTKSGHFYFTFKDQTAAIKAVMFQTNARAMRFLPQNGMNVIIFGSVRFYDRDGVCQIYCADMQPDGVGALYLAFEQLKERLTREGLFDPEHKKQLPRYPKRIGLITAKTGAALQDMLNIFSRRYPIAELVLFSTLVQGEQAPASICKAFAAVETASLDLVIVGRGGGSLEDLWAFNDESVARAIYHCSVPVISAVGHETDFTIADFAADLRAPTPSAAAELAAPDISVLLGQLGGQRLRMEQAVNRRITELMERFAHGAAMLTERSPLITVERAEERLQRVSQRLDFAMGQLLQGKQGAFTGAVTALEALSPLKVLNRGYSITEKNGRILYDAKEAAPGDLLETRLATGIVLSRVEEQILAK